MTAAAVLVGPRPGARPMTPFRLLTAVVLALIVGPGCVQAPAPPDKPELPPPPFSAGRTIDLAAVQGKWVVAKIEPPTDRKFPADELDALTKDAVATINGDFLVFRFRPPGGEEKTERAFLQPDPAHTPKRVDVLPTDERGRPLLAPGGRPGVDPVRYAAVYKGDADALVVAAAAESGGPRPTEFKPGPGVIVVHLKRK